MKANLNNLHNRIRKKGSKLARCDYRVIAVGINNRGNIIDIKTNLHRFNRKGGGRHAEERIIHSTPRSLARIYIARFGSSGELLPIDPCPRCQRLADKYNVKIDNIEKLI